MYLMDARSDIGFEPVPLKLERLLDESGVLDVVGRGDRVAVKIHSGEYGNIRLVRPVYYERIVRKIKERGGKPFLTDSGVNYKTGRNDGIDHYVIASRNGYDYHQTGAPFIVADGIDGADGEYVAVPGEYIKRVRIASAVFRSDVLISVDHFTAHPSGVGGSIKNLGMGAVCRETKIMAHAGIRPQAKPDVCNGCSICVKVCPELAIDIVERLAVINVEKCVGCGMCVYNCPTRALSGSVSWADLQPRIAEAAAGVRNHFGEKFAAISFMMDMDPDCDCTPTSDLPIAPDIGVAVSKDLVALDKACIDLVNEAPHYPGSKPHTASGGCQCDKFVKMREHSLAATGYHRYYEVAERLGAGSTQYEIIRIRNRRPKETELQRLLDW